MLKTNKIATLVALLQPIFIAALSKEEDHITEKL